VQVVLVALLVVPAPAAAQSLRWMIRSADDLDDWSQAAAETWPDGMLAVGVWDGDWPPQVDGLAIAHAYLDDLEGHPALFVCASDGEDITLPLDTGGGDSHASRCAILLILRGMTSPLGIGDEGWMPPAPPPPEDEAATVPEPPSTTAPPSPTLLSIGLAVGASGRPGLAAPSVAVTVSPSVRLAGSGSVDLHLVADVTADLGSRVDLGSVPARLDALLIAGGLEIRPTVRRTTFGLGVGGGAHVHWAQLPDHADLPALAKARPALRFLCSICWPVATHVRVGIRIAWTLDLIEDEAPIRLELDQGSSVATAELGRWSLAGQAFVELGLPRLRRVP